MNVIGHISRKMTVVILPYSGIAAYRLMSGAGFSKITVKKDLAGLDRVVSGVLK